MEKATSIEMRHALASPFQLKDIEWRVQQSGFSSNGKPWAMVLAYVTARAVMTRLEDVFGIDGWEDYYEHENGGVMCTLRGLFKEENQWIKKQDGSPETAVEAFKGGISKALVRTAVKFGVGRYLYGLGSAFADCSLDKKNGYRKVYDSKTKKTFFWKDPLLPAWALPPTPGLNEGASDDKNTNQQTKNISKKDQMLNMIREKLGKLTDNYVDQNSINDICKDLMVPSFSAFSTMNEQQLSDILTNVNGLYK